MNKRFNNITNYDIQNHALHFNNGAVSFYLDFSSLCRPICWNATVSPFALVLILFRGTPFTHQNISRKGVPPRLHHCLYFVKTFRIMPGF